MPAKYPGNAVSKEARAKTGGGFESALVISAVAAPVRINLAANAIDPNSWQATLGAEFDIVETFDHLQDWTGVFGGTTTDLPVLTDGSPGMWGRRTNDRRSIGVSSITGFQPAYGGGEDVTYSGGATGRLWKTYTEDGQAYLQTSPNTGVITIGETVTGDTSGATATVEYIPNWIRDHGPEFTFRGGKSACINYNNFDNGIDGFGPSRLEMFFGNGATGKSGYKKVHVFFMLKFRNNFFTTDANGDFHDVGVVKFMEIETGFTAVDYYGTSEEQATVKDLKKHTRDYGCNLTFINCHGGGGSTPKGLFFREHRLVADQNLSGLWGYKKAPAYPRRLAAGGDGSNGDWSASYLNGQWMGVELILDTGTVDTSDGTTPEMFIYDETGVELHHFPAVGNQRVINHFDHVYNKIVFGGNRVGNGYDEDKPDEQDSRYYIDDVIVHGDRIAPTYFQRLAERV